tara:strand:- start:102 stop:854 length:753 start_codon:yes stop_codon:yes gene_type:complete
MSQDQGQMFNQQQEQPAQPDQGNSSMFKVGDREYTPEDAAKKIENADKFIETLKSERSQDAERLQSLEAQLAALTSKLDTATKLEDVLNSKRDTQVSQPAEQTTPPAVDEDAILAKLREKMNEESQTTLRAKNMKDAISKASEKYGSEWQTKLKERGKEVGMDEKAIQAMAETSPQAFAELFKLTGSSKSEPAPNAGTHVGGDKNKAPEPYLFQPSTNKLAEQWKMSGKAIAEKYGFDYDVSVHGLPKQR